MAVITRRLEFDAGHRVLGHEGKCAHLHGHRYAAEISFEASSLDNLGRVIDYGVIKELIGGWIDKHWDHNMLLHPDDPLNKLWTGIYPTGSAGRLELFGGNKEPYIMERGNPTAENIAAELLAHSQLLLKGAGHHNIRITNVRIWETPNCCADCTPAMLQMMDATHIPLTEEDKEALEKGPITAFQKKELSNKPVARPKRGGVKPISRVLSNRGMVELQYNDFDPGKTEFGVPHDRLEEQMKILTEWAAKVPLGSSIDLVGDGFLFGKYVTSEKGIEFIPHSVR